MIIRSLEFILKLRDEESGQGLAEYALIILLVAIALIGGLMFFAGAVAGPITSFSDHLGVSGS